MNEWITWREFGRYNKNIFYLLKIYSFFSYWILFTREREKFCFFPFKCTTCFLLIFQKLSIKSQIESIYCVFKSNPIIVNTEHGIKTTTRKRNHILISMFGCCYFIFFSPENKKSLLSRISITRSHWIRWWNVIQCDFG